ncbi:MAG: diacylglycerol kinase family lipid kinase [Bacteroidetes bacterium]|nr:diacylglycerol kinase family lipid kinase [Bacteroidota bacterium]
MAEAVSISKSSGSPIQKSSRVFFIINKYAGTGFEQKVEGRIIDSCSRLNIEATIEYTQGRGHATELAQLASAQGFERVFVMGGDGTVNEAAQGLVHTTAALGILPAGSGNGLARHLSIPLKIGSALHLLEDCQVISMDTLIVNGHRSVNVSGIGFDAHIASRFGAGGKRGLAGYTKLVLTEFLQYREFEVLATLDDQTSTHQTFILALANSSQFGNNARVAPFASVCDGVMDVCFVRKVPFTQAIPFIARMFTGRIDNSRFVEIRKAREFKAQLLHPLPFHIDGEPYPAAKEINAMVDPGSLRMIVPKSASNI